MSEAANALADFLTKMDQKLDALDGKLERYSAYMVKKLNDTSDQLVNMQTAELKMLEDSLGTMGSQISAMERQIGAYLSPDTNNDAVIAKLTETSDALQHTMERSINLIGYHGDRLQNKLTESVRQIEEGMKQHSLVIENPAAVPEQLHALPENPEGSFENPEISVFEKPEAPVESPDAHIDNPEAEYRQEYDAPVENPEAVIDTGDSHGGV